MFNLLKALYGCNQSGRLWKEKLNSFLTSIDFTKKFKRSICLDYKTLRGLPDQSVHTLNTRNFSENTKWIMKKYLDQFSFWNPPTNFFLSQGKSYPDVSLLGYKYNFTLRGAIGDFCIDTNTCFNDNPHQCCAYQARPEISWIFENDAVCLVHIESSNLYWHYRCR